jgi:2-dehydro-3-deoxyphosphogluconate aldolase/(4S)-4-hydroxy-2-oxoglutarate aldolase
VSPPAAGTAEDAADGATFLLDRTPLIAIVRFASVGALGDVVAALAAGGIDLIEITIDTPGALAAVEQAAGAGHTIGVGTVVNAQQVRASARAGASFVVSPGLVAEVVQEARACGVEPIPGVFTATEALSALSLGARLLKLFPAGSVGAGYLRALRGPFSRTAFVPTGGIEIADIRSYLEAGAAAVALGSQLVGRTAPTTAEGFAELTARAALATRIAREHAAVRSQE